MNRDNQTIIITGAAGLVGQNLVVRLKQQGYTDIIAIDKHPSNTATLRRLHPDITVLEEDLAEDGEWQNTFEHSRAVIINQAQIGGLFYEDFARNNITATKKILETIQRQAVPPFIIHISSSVVNSKAVDFYTETKKAQEELVVSSGLPCTVFRPTLMFGWFDRKHLGWLKRFMEKVPAFPVPGNGAYIRQPLYVGDFCKIIIASIDGRYAGRIFDISGLEEITYIDIIREIKSTTKAKTRIVKIPYGVFWLLLKAYSLFDSNPPFTTKQLEALVIRESFPVIDWPAIFGISPTEFRQAVMETFLNPTYSNVVLDF
jgi:nucleoside-diphosphate-sugar epimerase